MNGESADPKGIDMVSGAELDEGLAGVETIIDTATGAPRQTKRSDRILHCIGKGPPAVGAAAGVRRIVVVSIIGITRCAD
ncbi:MAG TPA: hypothetical protein VLB79_03240 [Solirubrobacterales bacterium]|nr:hypothetical protein [Solirubrobacterales bacterium]